MKDIIKKIIKEEINNKKVNWDLIDFENGEVKCYHYSSKSFEDVVKVSGVRGKHSKEEFSTWGRSRSFFYLTEGGIYFDRGVGNLYKYVSYIPVNEIYDITRNSNNYDMSMGWESLYQQTSVDGYSAWVYNLGGKSNVPILVSFKPVPISEKYEKTLSGSYRIVGEDLKDVVVGEIIKDGKRLLVIQDPTMLVNIGNLYAIYPKDIDEKYRYKTPIHDFEYKDIKFKDKFIDIYFH